MYDAVATLRTTTVTGYDTSGNPTMTITDREVYVMPRGVYRSEFYDAAQLGLKPSLTLFISNRADYAGEKIVVFEGKEYSVIRTDWTAQKDGITLICEEKVRNE